MISKKQTTKTTMVEDLELESFLALPEGEARTAHLIRFQKSVVGRASSTKQALAGSHAVLLKYVLTGIIINILLIFLQKIQI